MTEKREIGLKAISAARAERQRSKHGRVPDKVWAGAGVLVLLTVAIAWAMSGRKLGNDKTDLLAKRNAAVVTLGKEWTPLRDRIEKITLEAAGEYKGDLVDPEAATWNFRSSPGIYLRLLVDDAKDAKTLRKRAQDSLKDAFTGCLLREPNAALTRGEPDAGTQPEQPWNLRQAYASTRILNEEWADEVKESSDDIRLRVFQQQYEKAQRDEIPLAIELVKRAEFYLLVLDEVVPEAAQYAGDAGTIGEEALQQVPHPARVHIVNLKTGKELVRLRRSADADFRFAGGEAVRDPVILASMRRQVNNCALAQEVSSALKAGAAK